MWPWKARDAEAANRARRARIEAEQDLEHRRAEGRRIAELTEEWSRIRERNNIAAAFSASMRGHR